MSGRGGAMRPPGGMRPPTLCLKIIFQKTQVYFFLEN